MYGAVKLADAINHVDRHADGAALISNGAGNCLADPPGGISREPETTPVFIFLDRFHQAQVALLNEIEERHTPTNITLCNADHKAGIGFYEVLAGILAVLNQEFELALACRFDTDAGRFEFYAGLLSALNPLGDRKFFCHLQQRYLGHFFQIQADGIVAG